jgi:elongation factor P
MRPASDGPRDRSADAGRWAGRAGPGGGTGAIATTQAGPVGRASFAAVFGAWYVRARAPLSVSIAAGIAVVGVLLVLPIAWLGRRALDARTGAERAARVTVLVHAATMTVLGAAVIQAFRLARQRPGWLLPVPSGVGRSADAADGRRVRTAAEPIYHWSLARAAAPRSRGREAEGAAMRMGSELRPRMVLRVDGALVRVLVADYHGGQGKMGGVMHAKLRDLATGKERERRFRAEEAVEEVQPERQSLQFLYSEGALAYFMNPESFEQVAIDSARLGKAAAWLTEETVVPVEFVDGEPLGIVFPEIAEARVAETAPPYHAPGTDNVWKEARLDNGVKVMVPPFVAVGEAIRVDIETGRYVGRHR